MLFHVLILLEVRRWVPANERRGPSWRFSSQAAIWQGPFHPATPALPSPRAEFFNHTVTDGHRLQRFHGPAFKDAWVRFLNGVQLVARNSFVNVAIRLSENSLGARGPFWWNSGMSVEAVAAQIGTEVPALGRRAPMWRRGHGLWRPPSTATIYHARSSIGPLTIAPSLPHSLTPSLPHSLTPSLHHSTTPPLHHSLTPSLPPSNA